MPANNGKHNGSNGHRKPFYRKVECGVCRQPIDVRGLKAHMTTHQRDAHSNGHANGAGGPEITLVKRETGKTDPISNGDWKTGYREGLLDGMRLAQAA